MLYNSCAKPHSHYQMEVTPLASSYRHMPRSLGKRCGENFPALELPTPSAVRPTLFNYAQRMVNMAGRVDDFHGDDKQYIAYLEGEVKRLRRTSDDRRSQAELLLSEEPQPPSKKPKTSRPPWKRHADALVRKAPRAPEWWAALQKEGIYDVMRNGLAVAFLLGDEGTLPTTAGAGLICDGSTPGDQLGLLRHVARYARNAATRRLTASVATRLANFQLLLVLSACAVIRAVAQPSVREDHLLDIVKICLGDVSDDYCRRMLDTAVYVNRLIDLLNAHGWDGRGAELLLLCTASNKANSCTDRLRYA